MEIQMVDCQVCGAGVSVARDVIVSELIACGECGTEYEVTGLSPIAVAEAPQEEEDWGE